MVTWIRPDAPAPVEAPVVARAKPAPGAEQRPNGIRLGILDNSKSNADHLLAQIIDALKADLPIASVVRVRKESPAIGATQAMLDQLAEEADLVITAMAD